MTGKVGNQVTRPIPREDDNNFFRLSGARHSHYATRVQRVSIFRIPYACTRPADFGSPQVSLNLVAFAILQLTCTKPPKMHVQGIIRPLGDFASRAVEPEVLGIMRRPLFPNGILVVCEVLRMEFRFSY